jgi:predicted ester cyclase
MSYLAKTSIDSCDRQVTATCNAKTIIGRCDFYGPCDARNRMVQYRSTSANIADHQSIMHSGHRLRSRHFQTILVEMNQMIPGTRFSAASV